MNRTLYRTLSFFSKWLAEVVRQPALMLSLVVGPFLILLAFGQGVSLSGPTPRTMVVMPDKSGPQHSIDPVPDQLNTYLDVVGQTTDLQYARAKLVDGSLDLVAVLPDDPLATIKRGQRAPVQALTNEIDPVRRLYAHAYLRDQIGTLNQRTLERAIREAQGSLDKVHGQVTRAQQFVALARSSQGDLDRTRRQVRELKAVVDPLAMTAGQASAAAEGASFVIPGLEQPLDQVRRLARSAESLKQNVDQLDARLSSAAGGAGAPTSEELARIEASLTDIDTMAAEAKTIPAWVLSAPFELQVENVAPFVPDYIGFYSPAVLALMLQHLAVTLAALSMARIRLLGLMELLRTSPVRPVEVVVGNYLSYGSLCAIAGGLLVALLVFLVGVPLFGSSLAMAGVLALLVTSSLGVGFVISMVSSSEQQAAQIAMLVLIASVFFSGFVVSVDTIIQPLRVISYLLPSTYAIRSLQDVMLRGVLRTPTDLLVLAGVSVVLFLATVRLFRREFRPG